MTLFKFRSHQRKFDEWFRDPKNYDPETGTLHKDQVSLNITPGGGKSMLPSIMAKHLIPSGAIDLICWVTPRLNLSKQAADSFEVDQGVYYNFHCPYKGRSRTNRAPILSHEEIFNEQIRCYTTTYNAILSAKNKKGFHTWMFNRYRVALVLDECHHLADTDEGQAFCEAVRPLKEMAAFTVLMTGTPDRNDGAQIPFIEYPKELYDKTKARWMPRFDVTYTREEAIADGAKLPINFKVLDGVFAFEEEDLDPELQGGEEGITLSTADELQRRQVFKKGMGTNSQYVKDAIDRTCQDFLDYKSATGYIHAQMIFVFTLQDDSEHWLKYIEKRWKLKVALAVSKNTESCAQIMRFKDGAYDALVTVGMAYEGLDAPAVTHMCVMRNIRSEPFLEQCFDRSTRVDYRSCVPRESQCAFIYVPSDERLAEIIRRLHERQGNGISELRKRVKENEIQDLKGELPRGVDQPVMFSQAVLDAIQGNSGVTDAIVQEAKASITDDSPLDQILKVNELERQYIKELIKKSRIEKGTYDPDEEVDFIDEGPVVVVRSRITGERLATMKHPQLSEHNVRVLETAKREFPELKWASADRILKAVHNGQLVLDLEVK